MGRRNSKEASRPKNRNKGRLSSWDGNRTWPGWASPFPSPIGYEFHISIHWRQRQGRRFLAQKIEHARIHSRGNSFFNSHLYIFILVNNFKYESISLQNLKNICLFSYTIDSVLKINILYNIKKKAK